MTYLSLYIFETTWKSSLREVEGERVKTFLILRPVRKGVKRRDWLAEMAQNNI